MQDARAHANNCSHCLTCPKGHGHHVLIFWDLDQTPWQCQLFLTAGIWRLSLNAFCRGIVPLARMGCRQRMERHQAFQHRIVAARVSFQQRPCHVCGYQQVSMSMLGSNLALRAQTRSTWFRLLDAAHVDLKNQGSIPRMPFL